MRASDLQARPFWPHCLHCDFNVVLQLEQYKLREICALLRPIQRGLPRSASSSFGQPIKAERMARIWCSHSKCQWEACIDL